MNINSFWREFINIYLFSGSERGKFFSFFRYRQSKDILYKKLISTEKALLKVNLRLDPLRLTLGFTGTTWWYNSDSEHKGTQGLHLLVITYPFRLREVLQLCPPVTAGLMNRCQASSSIGRFRAASQKLHQGRTAGEVGVVTTPVCKNHHVAWLLLARQELWLLCISNIDDSETRRHWKDRWWTDGS